MKATSGAVALFVVLVLPQATLQAVRLRLLDDPLARSGPSPQRACAACGHTLRFLCVQKVPGWIKRGVLLSFLTVGLEEELLDHTSPRRCLSICVTWSSQGFLSGGECVSASECSRKLNAVSSVLPSVGSTL